MFLKSFTKQYNLHLLPASHSGIILGNLVWKPFWAKPKLSHPGMPNHIANALYDAGIFSKLEWHKYLKSFDAEICKKAGLAKIAIKGANKVAASILDGLGLGFESVYLVNTEIRSVCAKVMDNEQRSQLDQHLDKVQPKLKRMLFRNTRKAYIITELYYGTLSVNVQKEHESAFEHQMTVNTNWPLKVNLNTNESNEYVFDHNEVQWVTSTGLSRRSKCPVLFK
jgi:hypothetical protein